MVGGGGAVAGGCVAVVEGCMAVVGNEGVAL